MADDEQTLPVIVRMRVTCAKCGHAEDETYEFDMPPDNAHPMEETTDGACPSCGSPVQIYLRRTSGLH